MYISNFSFDEFGKKSNEPYIQHRSETNLLNTFSNDHERNISITSMMASALIRSKTSSFSSDFHVKWAMEFLGYAFSLPIDKEEIIAGVIEIYRKWLLTDDRPACIKENESVYQQIIIGHFSLLFIERGGDHSIHAKLCTKVLLLLRQVTDSIKLSDESWKFILKILLLISNTILTNMGPLSEAISPLLLAVLFEIWIRSNTRDEQLWKELSQNSASWLDHIWFISQWGSVIVKLAHKVASLLYGDFIPHIKIIFAGLEENQIDSSLTLELEMTAETTIYLWHNFLIMMINNTKSKIPFDYKVHKELACTMSKIIDVFLEICDKRNMETRFAYTRKESLCTLDSFFEKINKSNENYLSGISRIPIPSANSLLKIFGEWLFFHALTQDNFSEIGNANAIGALCRIICKSQGPINQLYLIKFYKTLKDCFAKECSLILVYIINNSPNLFGLNHRGVKILAYDQKFLNSVKALLSDPSNIAVKEPCCIILSTIVGMNSILGNKSTSEIIKKIFIILLKSKNEPEVFKRIIWSFSVFAATETQQNVSEIIEGMMAQFQDLDYINQKINYSMLLTCISTFPYIAPNILNAGEIIRQLCSYVNKIQAKNATDSLILHLFCILNWIICFPNCYFVNSLQKLIIETMNVEFTNKNVKDCAEFVLGYLKNSLVNAYEYKGIKIKAGTINELSSLQLIKHFLYKSEFILSIYNVKSENSKLQPILCILRNNMGKFVWSTELTYSIKRENKQPLNINICNTIRKNENIFDESIDIPDDESYDKFSKLFELQNDCLNEAQQINKEEEFPECISMHNEKNEDPISYRMILSQLGLFHEDQLKAVVSIEGESISTIKELDEIWGKSQIVIPILYLQKSESKIDDSNICYSDSFLIFLNSIGIYLTEAHKGIEIFSTVDDFLTEFKSIIYNADSLNEIIFIVPVLNNLSDFSKILTIGDIFIFWNERADDPYSLKVPTILEDANLSKKNIIQLLPAGLNKVKIKRYKIESEGPLLDEMIIANEILPKLLIRTIINAQSTFGMRIKSKIKRGEILKKLSDNLLPNNELARIQKFLTNSFLG